MIRNLKTLGVALGAVLALGAMAASSASAVDTITGPAGEFPVTATSESHKFEITGPGVSRQCTSAHFEATANNGSKEVTVTPTYKGTINVMPLTTHCNAASIHMNGCKYILTGNTTGEDKPAVGKDATVWIECEPGTEIAITTLGVILHIPAQTPTAGGVTYTGNVPSAGKVTVHTTVTGITYTCTPALACFFTGIPSEGNNIDYTGTVVASSTSGNIALSEG
jgi:hypothetical protein